MELFRPYVWLRKQDLQFNEFFCISIPSGYRVSGGLQTPTDDTTSGVRTYQFTIEAHISAAASMVDSNVGNHLQPSGITKIAFQVIDVTDASRPIKKGEAKDGYQDGDEVS